MFNRTLSLLILAALTFATVLPAATATEDEAGMRLLTRIAHAAGIEAAGAEDLVLERVVTDADGHRTTERVGGHEALRMLEGMALAANPIPEVPGMANPEAVVGAAYHAAITLGSCPVHYPEVANVAGQRIISGGGWTYGVHLVQDPSNALTSEDPTSLSYGVWTHDPSLLAAGGDARMDVSLTAAGTLTTTESHLFLFGSCLATFSELTGVGAFAFNVRLPTAP